MPEDLELERVRSVSSSDSGAPGTRFFQGATISVRPIALAYRLITIALIATGLIRIIGIFSGTPEWNSLLFYTVLSNILCLVWMVLLSIRTIQDLKRDGARGTSTPSPRWSGAVMMAITVTLLIYLVILVPFAFQQAGDYVPFSFTDNLIHIITPCLLIGDWLLFVHKGAFRWIDPLLWTLIPYAYLVFGFTFGALGGEFRPGQKYPYPFMNLDTLGLGGVALWILSLSVALIGVGYVYVAIDRGLSRLSPSR
ncbi:Pr6Pr family membrane protein [Microbacterium aurantiacum]|uniref:Pr6Pr family membrane protein n=1 Tax=Microbacterium aurantiacum TaxID=162393 RepID=UPI000C80F095|nr:Pr6Pr family membrane protein [Microbacterium aurantiacum]